MFEIIKLIFRLNVISLQLLTYIFATSEYRTGCNTNPIIS